MRGEPDSNRLRPRVHLPGRGCEPRHRRGSLADLRRERAACRLARIRASTVPMGVTRPTAMCSSLTMPVAVALLVWLFAPGWADDKTAASCCDQSSMECNSGQSVGDKGSCPTTDVCVQIADKCKKKHPGVFCSCGS